jgi:hypothetical protein
MSKAIVRREGSACASSVDMLRCRLLPWSNDALNAKLHALVTAIAMNCEVRGAAATSSMNHHTSSCAGPALSFIKKSQIGARDRRSAALTKLTTHVHEHAHARWWRNIM